MSEAILRTVNLTKKFGGLTATDNLSLNLPGGRLQAIIGPNGAGKTTLFNLISGLLKPDSGRVFFRDRDITGLRPHEISRLGIKRTMQIKSVFNQLSVTENLWITRQASQRVLHPFRPASRDAATRERVDQTLEQIGMTALAHRIAGTLSYGDIAMRDSDQYCSPDDRVNCRSCHSRDRGLKQCRWLAASWHWRVQKRLMQRLSYHITFRMSPPFRS